MTPKYAWGCPTCGEKAFDRCRSLTTGRVTDTHVARLDAGIPSGYRDPEGGAE